MAHEENLVGGPRPESRGHQRVLLEHASSFEPIGQRRGFGPTSTNTPLTSTYVTAMVTGRSGSFAIKGGNSQSGTLTTLYDGARPATTGYNPMKKEGAIILGIGGDNSNSAQGNFFEGCMTSGASSNATDDAVQANIVAAGYGH